MRISKCCLGQLKKRTNASALRNGIDKAHFFEPIIYPHARTSDFGKGGRGEMRNQRQAEKAVGDRPAERRLRTGSPGIGMDELMIQRRVGEAIDHFLVDRQPG